MNRREALTDTELAALVAAGDEEALAELYGRYGRIVYSMAISSLREPSGAEDVTQEVFAALWVRAGRFDGERGIFRHWFLHLAHNRIVDELRRRKRAARFGEELPDPVSGAGPVAGSNTADEAVRAVLFGSAREALERLPSEQRQAIVLAYLEGATQQEISQRTGAPLGTVKTRLRLGLMKLRAHLMLPQGTEGTDA